MVILVEKLGRFLKFPAKLEHHHHPNLKPLSASLRDFRREISDFLGQPEKRSEFMSLEWFHNCFELIDTSNRAFAKLVTKIDYPMSQWGGGATEEYLNYNYNLLGLLNSVTSSISHLNQAKISIFHALSLVKNSPSSAPKYLKKIVGRNLDFKVEGWLLGIEEKAGSDEKECVVLQALTVLKKIGFLALGLVVSGLCGDAKLYMEIRKFPGGFDDPLIKLVLESRFGKEVTQVHGHMKEVEEVNGAAEGLSAAISAGKCDETVVGELNGRLEELENSMKCIEKQANNLFSQVLATRNKLLDNLRFTGQHP